MDFIELSFLKKILEKLQHFGKLISTVTTVSKRIFNLLRETQLNA
jgi:hypothetical protein